MAYSANDIRFLTKMADEGYNKEQALARLKVDQNRRSVTGRISTAIEGFGEGFKERAIDISDQADASS